jgi:hypothetical protein
MAEVQGERLRAEQEQGEAVPQDQLTKEQIRKLVLGLKEIAAQLLDADPRSVYSPTALVAPWPGGWDNA